MGGGRFVNGGHEGFDRDLPGSGEREDGAVDDVVAGREADGSDIEGADVVALVGDFDRDLHWCGGCALGSLGAQVDLVLTGRCGFDDQVEPDDWRCVG